MVTLAERHGGIEVTREIYEAMVDEVAALIAPFARDAWRRRLRGIHMLGTSGTVTTDRRRASRSQALRPQPRRRLLDERARKSTRSIERLLAMSYEERVASPCIGAERADLVLAGCAILEAIRRAFPCPRLRVADRGLREGMLVQMMREDGVWDGGIGGGP